MSLCQVHSQSWVCSEHFLPGALISLCCPCFSQEWKTFVLLTWRFLHGSFWSLFDRHDGVVTVPVLCHLGAQRTLFFCLLWSGRSPLQDTAHRHDTLCMLLLAFERNGWDVCVICFVFFWVASETRRGSCFIVGTLLTFCNSCCHRATPCLFVCFAVFFFIRCYLRRAFSFLMSPVIVHFYRVVVLNQWQLVVSFQWVD